jgi:hypothetical protein
VRATGAGPRVLRAGAPAGSPAGFVIENGAAPLDPRAALRALPNGGDRRPAATSAVTASAPGGDEDTTSCPAHNALKEPVDGKVAPSQVIWLGP